MSLSGRCDPPSDAAGEPHCDLLDQPRIAVDGVFDSGFAAVLDVLDFANAMADEVPGRGTGVVSSAMREQVDELGGTLAALVME